MSAPSRRRESRAVTRGMSSTYVAFEADDCQVYSSGRPAAVLELEVAMHALVAVDLEAEEQELYADALELLDRLAATVSVVTVDTWRPATELASLVAEELAAREERHRRALDALLVRFPLDRRGRVYLLERRDAAQAIVDLAPGHDVIVVGTHGRRGVQRLWLGSVAERVVRSSAIPVLVLRRPLPAFPPGTAPDGARMLVAVDLEQGADPLAAEAVRWALALRARVDALYVDRASALADRELLASGGGVASHLVEVDRSARGKLEEWMERLPAELRGAGMVEDRDDVAAAIVEASAAYQALLVGTRGNRGPARLWLGSVAERVVRLAEIPVVVAPLVGSDER